MKRGSGILIHITSLPSQFGIGDFGPSAYEFIDFLVETEHKYWQILPLNLTEPILGNSPYSSISAFAMNIYLLSPDLLVEEGLLEKQYLNKIPLFNYKKVEYEKVINFKKKLYQIVLKNFDINNEEYLNFCKENAHWLNDFALFLALKKHFNGEIWNKWETKFKKRDSEILKKFEENHKKEIEDVKILQYLTSKQWFSLKKYANEKGIKIIGDIPIYVNYDSVDVWSNPQIFKLNDEGMPLFVAGVPPDYFSKTGQLWGNPVYDWQELQKNQYLWWVKRIEHNLKLFDFLRLDHFRGFEAYWEVPYGEKTAINGKWVKAPGFHFFSHLKRNIKPLNLIAEDLGTITDEVRKLINYFGFPGMKVLQFAFFDDVAKNPYAPHNHIKNCIVYTGTHDNNTILGWFEEELSKKERDKISFYIGIKVNSNNINYLMIRMALSSVANVAIIPMQDYLKLPSWARMNRPSFHKGNWQWRLEKNMINDNLIELMKNLNKIYNRGFNDQ